MSYSEYPTINAIHAIALVKRQQERGEQLLSDSRFDSADFNTWSNTTIDILVRSFGIGSMWIRNFEHVRNYGDEVDELRAKTKMLGDCIDILEATVQNVSGEKVTTSQPELRGHEVFIVHGHNEGVREKVARLVEKLGLTAIVLHERPNEGQTIIEKFEKHSASAGFAVVLLTGDDRGGQRDLSCDAQSLRARQNVILELGYFIARLGRARVCALYEKGVEIPSDYHGVLFVELDAVGKWKFDLAHEMKTAGLPIDMNVAY